MKTIAASALTATLLFVISFSYLKVSEAEVNSLSQITQTSPTPPKKKTKKEEAPPLPTPTCSPQPTPLSEEEKNDPDRREFGEYMDSDCDGICDVADNCVLNYNPNQKDRNKDGKGDACDPKLVDQSFSDSRCDNDGDGVPNNKDNCNLICNPEQEMVDVNGNNVHDACDSAFPNRVFKPCAKRIKVKPPRPPKPKNSSSKKDL